MNVIIKWVLFALALMFIAWLIPGIHVGSFPNALFVAVVIGLINAFIKPVIQLITLPINIFTLGLFGLIINALLLMLASAVAPGFEVSGFLNALIGSILLSAFGVAIDSVSERF